MAFMTISVLLVEDDPSHAELIRRAFASHDTSFRLNVASTLRDARTLMREEPPDLAIVDLFLPDGKGMDLLSEARPEKSFPIVIMTSYGDEKAAVEAIKTGALHYVVKSTETLSTMPQIAEGALREWGHMMERRKAEIALQASERRYRTLYDDHPSMFFTIDLLGKIVSANRFAAGRLGFSVADLVGRPYSTFCTDDSEAIVRRHLRDCFREPDRLHRWECCQESRQGVRIWVRTTARTVRDDHDQLVVLMVCEDITEAHRLSEKLSYQASHDPLTSLFNRREFEGRLETALREAREDHSEHALCYLDLDQFKVINDTCGHMAGDMLLRQLGGLLAARVRKGDTLARLGGDEFGILIKHCMPKDALHVADSFRQLITEFRFIWEDKTFQLGVSIGLVPIDETSDNIANVLAAADRACYAAKDRGRNRIHIYHKGDAVLEKQRGEMRWVARIHKALQDQRFRLAYQPIVPIRNGTKAPGLHYEVLIRMIDENQNLVGPDAFLPAAERYNLISKIDRWVVESTFSWLARHPKHLDNLGMCSINLSGQSLGDAKFLEHVTYVLGETGIPAAKICFEVTETSAIANLAGANEFIRTLKAMGCRFALDDFGCGLSSFAYLKNLPVDYLKIDGMFVKDIVDDPIDMAVVSSINEIGHVMGKETIAEFVEDDKILEKLREMGIDYAQGYGIGRPQLFTE